MVVMILIERHFYSDLLLVLGSFWERKRKEKKKKKNSLISDKLTNAWCKLTHERRVFEGDHVVMYNVFNLLGIGWIEYELWSTVLSKKENDEHCPGVESLEFTHL